MLRELSSVFDFKWEDKKRKNRGLPSAAFSDTIKAMLQLEPINFAEHRFHYLAPFSAHEIEIDGVIYKTAEHAYQALRVIPEARHRIIAARSPLDAWREGQKCKENNEVLLDYDKDALMEQIFRAKLKQHDDVKQVLIESGERGLLKLHGSDYYWGTGADGSGKNRMGKIWMKLREEIK
ncbi:NADAR family protein [Candidatus Parcubacteria bacterium]|nr:NADAR family protein [Candidatus Parcubacteria bacterium]